MATHSTVLAWEIPWTEKPGGYRGLKELNVTEHARRHAGTQDPAVSISPPHHLLFSLSVPLLTAVLLSCLEHPQLFPTSQLL